MNPHETIATYVSHIYNTIDLYDERHHEYFVTYLCSLHRLMVYSIASKARIPKHRVLKHLNTGYIWNDPVGYMHDIIVQYDGHRTSHESWGRTIWRLLGDFAEILNNDTRDDIKLVVTLMPHVSVRCKKICVPHMIRYIHGHAIDVSSTVAFQRWVSAFKRDVKRNT